MIVPTLDELDELIEAKVAHRDLMDELEVEPLLDRMHKLDMEIVKLRKLRESVVAYQDFKKDMYK